MSEREREREIEIKKERQGEIGGETERARETKSVKQ